MAALGKADLIAAEHARRKAIMNDDVDALDAMTADSFTYAHINGLIEDRASYLGRLREKRVKIHDTQATDLSVTLRTGYALLTGISSMTFEWLTHVDAGEISTFFLAVWEPGEGRWKISAYASTPMPQA